jgi:hypothetical protein
MNRPTFYINDNPIRAGGVIFYYQDELTKNIKLLLQYTERTRNYVKRFLYEDIGGKTDEGDESINDTVIREVVEETNGVINKELITKYLTKDVKKIYLEKGKYCLFLVKVNDDIKNVNRRLFGKEETLSGKQRQFFWIDADRLRTRGTPFNERIWLLRDEINDFFSTLM